MKNPDALAESYRYLSWIYILFLSLLFLDIGKPGLGALRWKRLRISIPILFGTVVLANSIPRLLFYSDAFSIYIFQHSPIRKVLVRTLSNALFGFTMFFLKRSLDREDARQAGLAIFLILSVFIQIILFIFVLFGGIYQENGQGQGVFMLTLMGIGSFYTAAAFFLAERAYRFRMEQNYLNMRDEEEKKRISDLETMYQNLREVRHDLRSQIRIAEEMFRTGRTEESVQYIQELQNLIEISYNTGCTPLDSELTMKARSLRDKHIGFSTELSFPEKLPLTNIEICSVVSNLLNNAEEELTEHPVREAEPRISLSIKQVEKMLIISCENPTDSEVTVRPHFWVVSTKGENRGFGLKIIRNIAEKHNGIMTVSADGGVFSVIIGIPMI